MTGKPRYDRFRINLVRVRKLAVSAAAIFLLTAAGAEADICDDLRAQLREASAIGPGTSAQARRYAEAATRQIEEIQKTRAMQQRRGCFANATAECQSLYRTIQEMNANLDALERQRDRLSGGRNAARIRAIGTRLGNNGCNAPQRVARTEPHSVTVIPEAADRSPRKSRIIVREGIGRQRLYNPNVEGDAAMMTPADPADTNKITIPYMAGTFRTLCVRTCDGYYFPISFSTGFDFLKRDAETCESMCPGTEAKLFFHRVPDQESEAMISLQGQPYTALPQAFLYRKLDPAQADPSCTCQAQPSTARLEPDAGGAPDLTAVPETEEKPEVAATPEDSTGTGSAPQATMSEPDMDSADLASDMTEEEADGSRKIRVVGPEFLPAPEEAIDLQSRDRTTDR